ncbi:acyl-CoA dehydrogenase family protein [Seohaeicola sp.]|uniref:acyl-CoA dehydrogenase family protein n=1 Tax=Seohaeicola sp. TaxID=2042026 RepID=UPI003A847A12
MISKHEIDFIMDSVCELDTLLNTERFEHLDRDSLGQVFASADRVAHDHFAPIAEEMDAQEVFLHEGTAKLHGKVDESLRAAAAVGLFGMSFPFENQGSQLPHCVTAAVNSALSGANVALNAFMLLTAGSARLIASFGDDNQKSTFVEPMVSGRYFGTMCLSETHAGSSLAGIRTRAEPNGVGGYRISGEKMWITAGDHDLGENIIHLVLARLPEAPAGVKGISLFIVPKYRVTSDGTRGACNDVRLIGLNHKMGQRGVPNAVLRFGEDGACEGFLLGCANRGMAQMFQMMNELRLNVGAVASGVAYVGAQHARAYAAERTQGKPLDAKDPDAAEVAIINHPDVRRMLLAQRALSEGALALTWYCACLLDRIETADSSEDAERLQRRLDLLTPLAKTWPAEHGTRTNDISLQVLGGAGYTRDFPVERLYRDNRLNPIHEGTTGIQSLDFLRRKIVGEDAKSLTELLFNISEDSANMPAGLSDEAVMLSGAVKTALEIVEVLDRRKKQSFAGSGALRQRDAVSRNDRRNRCRLAVDPDGPNCTG